MVQQRQQHSQEGGCLPSGLATVAALTHASVSFHSSRGSGQLVRLQLPSVHTGLHGPPPGLLTPEAAAMAAAAGPSGIHIPGVMPSRMVGATSLCSHDAFVLHDRAWLCKQGPWTRRACCCLQHHTHLRAQSHQKQASHCITQLAQLLNLQQSASCLLMMTAGWTRGSPRSAQLHSRALSVSRNPCRMGCHLWWGCVRACHARAHACAATAHAPTAGCTPAARAVHALAAFLQRWKAAGHATRGHDASTASGPSDGSRPVSG